MPILLGFDVRRHGGYSVFPPSVRPEGPYAWTSTAPVAAPPKWLVDLVTGTRPASPASGAHAIVNKLDDQGADDPLAFTIEGRPRKSASSSRRQHVDPDEFLEGLPF